MTDAIINIKPVVKPITINSPTQKIIVTGQGNITVKPVNQSVQVSKPNAVVEVKGLVGLKGDKGSDGGIPTVGIFVANTDIKKGQPLYLSRANGKADIADSASYTKSFVIGFADNDTVAGFPVTVIAGICTLADWTDIAGYPALNKGETYFLKAGGGITTDIPHSSTNQALVNIGIALSATDLRFNPSQPIFL